MKKRLNALLIAIAALFCCCITAGAFDANDYDYDYSGGSSSNDDDHSYGGGYSYSYDDDDDDYSGYHSVGGENLSAGEYLMSVGVIVIVLVLGGIWVYHPRKKKGGRSGKNRPAAPDKNGVRPANGGQGLRVSVPDRTAQIRDVIQSTDPAFDNKAFVQFAKSVFVAVQSAWCARDLEPVRGVMHTNLYNTTMKQVQSKIDGRVTYHYEDIRINNAYLTSFVRDSEFEYLTVYLQAQYRDYQTDDNTGNVVRGDKNTVWGFRYKMKFMRSMTASAEAKFCPNCGAPLNITTSGVCEYCGSTVTTTSREWVLSDFTTVRDDTKDDGIRVG